MSVLSLYHVYTPPTRYRLSLVDLFTASSLRLQSLPHVKRALIQYFALLLYTNISHSSLAYFFPHPSASPAFLHTFLVHTLLHLQFFHPRSLLFLPTLIPFLPGYALSALASRLLVAHREEEAAQAKAVAGGIGIGIGCLGVGWAVVRWVIELGIKDPPSFSSDFATGVPMQKLGWLRDGIVRTLASFGRLLGNTGGGWVGTLKRAVGILGVLYMTGWALVKWHNLFVRCRSSLFSDVLLAIFNGFFHEIYRELQTVCLFLNG